MSVKRTRTKSFKKFIVTGVVFSVVCAAFLSAGFYVRGRERARFPKGGIYFAGADSYYAYSDRTQNPLVTLTCFEVKKGGYKGFLSYEDLVFGDSDGGRYAPKDISVVYTFSDYYMSRILVQAVLDITAFECGSVCTLDKVYLTDGDEETAFGIGSVRIALYEGSSDNSRISFSGYTSGASVFSSYTTAVSNNGDKSIIFEKFCLDVSCGFGIKVYDRAGGVFELENFELSPGESAYIRAEFSAEGTKRDFPFNYLKPALCFSINGESRVLSVNGVSDYLGRMDRTDIQGYLKGRAGT